MAWNEMEIYPPPFFDTNWIILYEKLHTWQDMSTTTLDIIKWKIQACLLEKNMAKENINEVIKNSSISK